MKATTSHVYYMQVIAIARCNHVLPSSLVSDLLFIGGRKEKDMNLFIPKISIECLLGARY